MRRIPSRVDRIPLALAAAVTTAVAVNVTAAGMERAAARTATVEERSAADLAKDGADPAALRGLADGYQRSADESTPSPSGSSPTDQRRRPSRSLEPRAAGLRLGRRAAADGGLAPGGRAGSVVAFTPDAEDPDRAREALRAILAALDAASPKATRPEGATQERACKPAGFA